MSKGKLKRLFRPSEIGLGNRLALGFACIALVLIAGTALVLRQAHSERMQASRLTGIDQELISILRFDADLRTFDIRFTDIIRLRNTKLARQASQDVRATLTHDSQAVQLAFSNLPPEVSVDPAVVVTMKSVEDSLPQNLDGIDALATAGDWDALRERLARQVQPLEFLSSQIIAGVDKQVANERARAVEGIRAAERTMLIIVLATGIITLFVATGLGLILIRSVSRPLACLMEASRALARGEFEHRIKISGKDELAHLALVFNDTASRLRLLYDNLRSREAELQQNERELQIEVGERRAAEQSLQRQKDQLDGLFELAPEAVIVAGDDLKVVRVNREFLRMFGYKDDQVKGQSLLDLIVPEDLRDGSAERAVSSAAEGRVDLESVRHRIDGSRLVTSISAARIALGPGHQVLYIIYKDVTEQRRARTELENAFEEIKRLRDRLQEENFALREQIDQAFMFEEIVGSSPALKSVFSSIVKVAPTDSTVLVTGETGTGKELIARALHKQSQRANQPFISINCASVPPSLIASELFGHEKGAFTGALLRREGRFELAHGGTLFLDEVGELPLETQVALLRVLQERRFERVGGTRSLSVDVRLIAATNRDLPAAIVKGLFREDLFYRLNVFPITLPPLRRRREDIPVLVEYFTKRYAEKARKPIAQIDHRSMELCKRYDWPGNVRELQNIIERSVILCTRDTLHIDPAWLSVKEPRTDGSGQLAESLQLHEKEMIEAALAESGGIVAGPNGAAVRLGIPRSTLDWKIKQLKISKDKFAAKG